MTPSTNLKKFFGPAGIAMLPTGWENYLDSDSNVELSSAASKLTADPGHEYKTEFAAKLKTSMQIATAIAPKLNHPVPTANVLPTFTPPTESQPVKPPATTVATKDPGAEPKPKVEAEPKQHAAPAAKPASATPAPKPAAPAPAPSATPRQSAGDWWNQMVGYLRITGIVLGLLLVAALVIDYAKPEMAADLAKWINPTTTPKGVLNPPTGPWFDSLFFTNIKSNTSGLQAGVQSALVIAFLFQLFAVADVLSGFTGADIPGLLGQGIVLFSLFLNRPIDQLGWLLAGMITIRRDRDAKSPLWLIPTAIASTSFGLTLLGQNYNDMGGGLVPAIIKRLGSLLFNLTPENVGLVAYPIILMFLVSYWIDRKLDGSGMSGALLMMATVVALGKNIPFTTIMPENKIKIAYWVTLGIMAFMMEFRETTARLAKPVIGNIVTLLYWVIIVGEAVLIHYAIKGFKPELEVGILWLACLSAIFMGLVPGILHWAPALAGGDQKMVYKYMADVFGDVTVFWIFFFPSAWTAGLVVLWIVSLVANIKVF